MIEVRAGVNELEAIVVMDHLQKKGVTYAVLMPGNDCVWVARGSANCPINEYYIFSKGLLVDIQID